MGKGHRPWRTARLYALVIRSGSVIPTRARRRDAGLTFCAIKRASPPDRARLVGNAEIVDAPGRAASRRARDRAARHHCLLPRAHEKGVLTGFQVLVALHA